MKNIFSKTAKFFITAKVAIVFALLSSTCFAMPFFNKNKLPTTPYALPIDISKKGNKAEVDLRIKADEERKRFEPKTIAFELKFIPYDPEDDPKSKYYISSLRKNLIMIGALRKYFEPQRTKEERKEISRDHHRLSKLLGGGFTVDDGTKYGKHVDYPAVPLPNIRLTIIDLNDPDKKVVYDEVLEVTKHPNIAGYFYKFLSYIKLIPSSYKIIAEVQSDASEFEGTEVLLLIGSERAWWK